MDAGLGGRSRLEFGNSEAQAGENARFRRGPAIERLPWPTAVPGAAPKGESPPEAQRGRRLQGSGGSEVARQQRKANRQLKRFVGRPYGGFVVRPDQSSDGVPRRRQVGKGQASASPRGDKPQGGRLGGASQGAGCLRRDVADRSAVRAEGRLPGRKLVRKTRRRRRAKGSPAGGALALQDPCPPSCRGLRDANRGVRG